MNIGALVLFVAGVALVVGGAELIVRGASRLAVLLGVRPLVIGLTVVAMGTSVPELAVGIVASLEGAGALAVGNIAGANLINILLILGLSALIKPLPLRLLSLRLDLSVMIAAALALILFSFDGVLSRLDGALLVGGGTVYTIALVRMTRRERDRVRREFSREFGAPAVLPPRNASAGVWQALLFIVGLFALVWGANMLVTGAVDLARAFGVSDAVIGLTIVAIGTCAPELATTLAGTMKGDRDVAVGNVVGSCIYNILFVLGIICVVAPGGVPVSEGILLVDLPLAAAVAIVCVPVFTTDRLISRGEGALFVAGYALYLATLLFVRA